MGKIIEVIVGVAEASLPGWAVVGIAVAAAILGAYLAKWLPWHFEQKKMLRLDRKSKVDAWRKMFADVRSEMEQGNREMNVDGMVNSLRAHPAFQSLQQHISLETRRKAMNPFSIIVPSAGSWLNEHLDLIAKEVDRLERKWDLL
jgi:hypothetical protein